MKTHLVVVLAMGLIVAADKPKDKDKAAEKDQAKLQGVWLAVSMERDGEKVPEEVLKKLGLTFKDDKVIPKGQAKASYKLDPAKNPKTIDITPDSGDEAGKTVAGIYSLDGDNLKICLARPGKERPAEFATKADSGRLLVVLKREK